MVDWCAFMNSMSSANTLRMSSRKRSAAFLQAARGRCNIEWQTYNAKALSFNWSQ